MEFLSVSDFRSNMASSFNRVDRGEDVLIRRKNEVYALVRVSSDELTLTPELQRRIDEVRQNYSDGNSVACTTHEELDELLNSL